ncbi:hypothetical protein AMTRI_Chr09g40760 [Amborella trichopoda]
MDQRVEKLKGDVSSLNVGQQQIKDKLKELFETLSSKSGTTKTEKRENSRTPLSNHGERSEHTNENCQHGTQQSFVSKLVKLDFPRFNGSEDTTNWTCRVEQFFQFYQTPKEERVALASFHLEGDAQV